MSRVITSPVGIRQVSYVLCSMTGPSADPMISTCQDRRLRAERPALVIARAGGWDHESYPITPITLCRPVSAAPHRFGPGLRPRPARLSWWPDVRRGAASEPAAVRQPGVLHQYQHWLPTQIWLSARYRQPPAVLRPSGVRRRSAATCRIAAHREDQFRPAHGLPNGLVQAGSAAESTDHRSVATNAQLHRALAAPSGP